MLRGILGGIAAGALAAAVFGLAGADMVTVVASGLLTAWYFSLESIRDGKVDLQRRLYGFRVRRKDLNALWAWVRAKCGRRERP